MNEVEEAQAWWANLTGPEKARWLRCEATPEELDADLRSSNRALREAAEIATVGDAFATWRAAGSPAGEDVSTETVLFIYRTPAGYYGGQILIGRRPAWGIAGCRDHQEVIEAALCAGYDAPVIDVPHLMDVPGFGLKT